MRYTRNMVTGASTAELALVLVDARNGIVEQSRRHAYLSALLGIRHLVACVNKMDLVDWDEERFREIESEFRGLADRLGVPDATVIPISALHGDNVVERSRRLAVVRRAAAARAPRDRRGAPGPDPRRAAASRAVDDPPARRPGRRRGYAGQLAGGVLAPGDEVVVLPSGERTTVAAVDTHDGPVEPAVPPLSVSVRLADDLDVGRGDLICAPDAAPVVARELDATVCWMADAGCGRARATCSSTRRAACARRSRPSIRGWT